PAARRCRSPQEKTSHLVRCSREELWHTGGIQGVRCFAGEGASARRTLPVGRVRLILSRGHFFPPGGLEIRHREGVRAPRDLFLRRGRRKDRGHPSPGGSEE